MSNDNGNIRFHKVHRVLIRDKREVIEETDLMKKWKMYMLKMGLGFDGGMKEGMKLAKDNEQCEALYL